MIDIINQWLRRDPDPTTQQELQALIDNHQTQELEDRFRSRLAFGTAGLRGLLGAGPNRMNRLVVQETTAGLGNYLQTAIANSLERGVVIGYDGRRGSSQFASDAASVLAAQGFRVFIFDRIIPTPTCAFALMHLEACAGIMVTASHNPPDYNGYKVYWENGAQIIPPHDNAIATQIERAAKDKVPYKSFELAHSEKQITYIEESVIEAYLSGIEKRALFWAPNKKHDLKIVYTPLHGVGAELTEACMARAGFEHFHTVPTQREPDGHFPTVNFPNPEEDGAMDASIELAQELHAELIVANDPDADRLAVALPTQNGHFTMLSGNEIGVILGHALLGEHQSKAVALGTTIVSSRLLGAIAQAHGATYFETLTGFKWIANKAIELEREKLQFLMGYEEAIGYTIGDLVRDKDGISALLGFALLTSKLKKEGKTILSYLEEIYRHYGLYHTAQKSLNLSPGADAGAIGKALRNNQPSLIAGKNIVAIADLLSQKKTHSNGEIETIELPQSDVLTYYLEDESRIIIRPSGTEPKIKCYYETISEIGKDESFSQAKTRANARMTDLIGTHQIELSALS